LEAARLLLSSRGFQDVVLDDVARAAGVAKGTLFLYFKCKEDLISAVLADLVDQLGERLEELAGSGLSGRPLVERTIRTILVHFDRNRDFFSQLSSGRLPGCGVRSGERILDKFRENYHRVVRILRLCVADGSVRQEKVAFAAGALFGLCRAAAFQHFLRDSKAPLWREADRVAEFFLHGASGRP